MGRIRTTTLRFTVVPDPPPAGDDDFSLTAILLTPEMPPLSSTIRTRVTVNSIGGFSGIVHVELVRAPMATQYIGEQDLRPGESVEVRFPAAHYGLGETMVTFQGIEV